MKSIRSIAPVLLTLFLIALFVCLLPTAASAATITTTVNIAAANKNERGDGYYWANRTDTLTLTNMHIDTEEPYGLRLPKDCEVILQGNNTVKAAKYGVSCSGTVVFKGTGSLTVEAGEIGFYLISQDKTQKIRLIDGKYTIKAGTYGVYSDAADFSFVGQSLDIDMASPDAYAISGRCVNLLGGTFKSNTPVVSSQQLVVNGVTLDINANRPAISSKNLEIKNIALTGGGEYDGGNSISAKGLARSGSSWFFKTVFDKELPIFLDFVLLFIVLGGIFALIFVPVLRKKKKTRELYERLSEEGFDVVNEEPVEKQKTKPTK